MGKRIGVYKYIHALREGGVAVSKWRTWLVPAEEGVAVEVKEETDVEAR